MEEGKKIILFDGVCNLCNNSVQFVIKRDKKDLFRYAALQSEAGQQMIAQRHIDTNGLDSIILIEPGVAYYTKSDAALHPNAAKTVEPNFLLPPNSSKTIDSDDALPPIVLGS